MTWRLNNATVLGNYVCGPWIPATAYILGDRVVCRPAYGTTLRRLFVYECTTAGTSHATTEPVWPTSGTIADGAGALVWTTRRPDDGTWNNASCYLHYILNHAAVAGATVYVHNAHSESVNLGAVYIVLGGTLASPIKILCVNKADDTLSTGAIVHNTNATGIRFSNHTYSYGITYSSTANITSNSGAHILEGNGTAVIKITSSAYLSVPLNNKFTILNGNFDLGNAANKILSAGPILWKGGALTGTSPTKLFDYFGNFLFECVDLSNLGNNDLFNVAALGGGTITLTRCKLPATFDYTTGAWAGFQDVRVKLHHCSNSNISYDFYEADLFGTLSQSITVYATGGANNGVTPFSMKMVSTSDVEDGILAFESLPINGWTNSTTEKTFTIEGIYDGVANLQNDEVWVDLQYPNSSSGLGLLISTKCVVLTAPADLTVSTKNWTSTGITNVNKFKFAITATPGKAGPIMARVYLAKASTTIYIDPMIVES